MCTGLEIAALGAAIGGTGASVAGQASVRHQNARDMDAQTKLSGAEFDKRNSLAKDIFAENATISKDTYTEMANLSDQEFATRTGLSKDAFNKLSRIQQDQVARDFQSATDNVKTGRDARIGRDTEIDAARAERDAAFTGATGERDAAYTAATKARDEREAALRAKYDADVAAANTAQTGFRNQGDTVASNLVAAFTPEAMAKRRVDAAAQRDALVADAISTPGSAASATADDNVRRAFARYSREGTAKAASTAQAGSNLAAYTDAVTSGDRTIDQGNESTAFVRDAAARALSPLGAVLDASSIGFNNAGATGADRISGLNARYTDKRTGYTDRYNDRTGAAKGNYADRTTAADADLNAALGLSSTRAAGETKPVVDYTSAMDNAYGAFFGGRQNTAGTRGDTLIGANTTKLQGSNSASSNFENNAANINQFKMSNNASGWTTLGQFASAIAPTLLNIGQRNAFAKELKNPVVNT